MSAQVLAISNQASRTGAPITLLRAMQSLAGRFQFSTLLLQGGPLAEAFAQLGDVRMLDVTHDLTWMRRVRRKIWDRPWEYPRRLRGWRQTWLSAGVEVVHNNTATNGRWLAHAVPDGAVVVTHVHETEASLARLVRPTEWRSTVRQTSRFVAVSQVVRDDLMARGVAATRIEVVPNFLRELPPRVAPADARIRLAESEFGMSTTPLLVVGCGRVDRIKGTDRFIALAESLTRVAGRPVRFVWVGEYRHAEGLASRRSEDVVRWVGPVADVGVWLAAADLVVVPSRAESFSLVVLEAAAAGRPVLATTDAVGAAEVLGGIPEALCAPEALRARVEHWLRAEAARDDLGQRLRERVAKEFLAEVQAPRLAQIWEEARRG